MNRFFLSALLAALIAFAGCGENHAPPAAIDLNLAKTSLERALTTWQKKGKPEDLLRDKSAPLQVADEDWVMGYQLVGFQLAPGEPKPVTDACVRFEVTLDLTSPKGQRIQRKAEYSVTTSPTVSVIRAETNA